MGKLIRIWRTSLRPMVLIIIAVTAFRSAIADWNDVPTGSMKPTILEGDRIVVNKVAYDLKVPYTSWRVATWDDPGRGEIVVLLSPNDGKRLVKRVIGLPGDAVAMRDNRLIVNDRPITYTRLEPAALANDLAAMAGRVLAVEELGQAAHPVMITPGSAAPRTFGTITIPDDCYFVMGDNRDESLDSRYFGFVPRDHIIGRAFAVAASVDPERHFLPRWRRFFQSLD